MKILLVTENAYCGGLDSFIITLINHWPYSEDELVLMCNAGHPGLEVIRAQLRRRCQIIGHQYPLPWSTQDVPQSRFMRMLRAPFRILGRQWLFLDYLRKFRRVFDELAADRLLVINGGYPAGLTCRAATVAWGLAGRRPLSVHNFHNFAHPARWWERIFENAIDSRVHAYAKAMVSVSRICADSLCSRPAFVGSSKRMYIYNGIEFREGCQDGPRMVRAGLGVAEQAPMCLMLGTYESRKGHGFLLQAFQRVVWLRPDARLVVCGFGYPSEIRHVRAVVDALGLQKQVRLEGFRQDVADLLEASDLLLVPSQSSESFGLTIVEAMSHQVPVIATRVGGMPEVLQDGEGGFLVEPDDVDGFAERMLQLINDEALRQQQGARGRRRFEQNFRAQRMVQEYADLVRDGRSMIA
ncbi:MAG: glycosyltransferase family 4 protein [Gammaproteobacteria bacterium]|nr:glycosyltransferase family 4 protein [Gammaproteobacteria bacterium]MBU0788313.1 glycosyltransferase family 4 protein [Gammaproteobacteria bacterium]MBU0815190.1 glycosyltransferase family 4 protein [Gammaproteobacteria bacterium]MBU1785702.1 glycosyltransferase family 4 protein [Gammaproteobacteria bacterium]